MRQPVLFDLDQTIVPWDTQLVFRSYVLQAEPWRRVFCLVFPLFLPLAKILGAGGLKRVFHCYLWRMKRERLEELAQGFVQDWLPLLVYPEIVNEMRAYQGTGREAILSSASPELWVSKIGEALGFDRSFGTCMEWGTCVEFFPDMIGENHKGEEKVKRLAAVGVTEGFAGYSDSKADIPMLELCEEKWMINPLPSFQAEGDRRGWSLLTPPRPWRTRRHFALACARQYFGFWRP